MAFSQLDQKENKRRIFAERKQFKNFKKHLNKTVKE